ncbi:hypothetical protein ASD15_02435 [Massilia sp. Root351]|jgi:hypothetical protein|uniref:hypothetical protein n=1 Tax=Massilia sp. Root351 TaxID=1736522 RepID=UPI00070BE795|nr:hypothetical protein [Massilia sp. Root351]KQV90933.1 hypothetical protein ASD15_02435 [Massilia sp. Root351]
MPPDTLPAAPPRPPSAPHLAARLLAATLAAALAGCGGGGGASPVPPPVIAPATELSVSASATGATAGGAPVQLTASLNGSGTVAWALAAGSPGALSAASGASVSYTPPASAAVNAAATVTIVATSGSLNKTLTLSLAPDPARPGLTLVAGNIGNGGENNWPRDGLGSEARFSGIAGIDADAAGNVYLADYSLQSSRLRKITPDGAVSTLSNGVRGFGDGPLAQARFEDLTGLSVAADGSIYLDDSSRHFVSSSVDSWTGWTRKLGADGHVSTLASYGTRLGMPPRASALAGRGGALYLVGDDRISVLKADGSTTLLAGGSDGTGAVPADVDGSGAAARFAGLGAVAAGRDGNLYALTSAAVRRITPAGEVSTLARLEPVQLGSASARPAQIGADAAGNVLVLFAAADQTSYQIRKLGGGALAPLYTVGTPQGSYKTAALHMRVLADGAVLVAGRHSVSRIGADGKAVLLAGLEDDTLQAVDGQGAAARYVHPGLLAADANGNIYSVEQADGAPRTAVIRKTTPSGAVSTYASAELSVRVTGMAVNPASQLLVTVAPLDGAEGGGLYRVEAGNSFTLIAGVPGSNTALPLQRDGTGIAARFGLPVLAGIDSAGNVYLEDRVLKNNSGTNVRMVTPQGVVSTVAALPAGLGAAPDGNRYRTDLQAGGIFRVAPDGSQTLVAGTPALQLQLGTELGALPGHLSLIRSIVPTGPNSFAVASGSAIVRLVLPPR